MNQARADYGDNATRPPRRRQGRLRALTLADRRRKAERNDRRGRSRVRVIGEKGKPAVGRVPVSKHELAKRGRAAEATRKMVDRLIKTGGR